MPGGGRSCDNEGTVTTVSWDIDTVIVLALTSLSENQFIVHGNVNIDPDKLLYLIHDRLYIFCQHESVLSVW